MSAAAQLPHLHAAGTPTAGLQLVNQHAADALSAAAQKHILSQSSHNKPPPTSSHTHAHAARADVCSHPTFRLLQSSAQLTRYSQMSGQPTALQSIITHEAATLKDKPGLSLIANVAPSTPAHINPLLLSSNKTSPHNTTGKAHKVTSNTCRHPHASYTIPKSK